MKFELLKTDVFALIPAQIMCLCSWSMLTNIDDSLWIQSKKGLMSQIVSAFYILALVLPLLEVILTSPTQKNLSQFYSRSFLKFGHCSIYSYFLLCYTLFRNYQIDNQIK